MHFLVRKPCTIHLPDMTEPDIVHEYFWKQKNSSGYVTLSPVNFHIENVSKKAKNTHTIARRIPMVNYNTLFSKIRRIRKSPKVEIALTRRKLNQHALEWFNYIPSDNW